MRELKIGNIITPRITKTLCVYLNDISHERVVSPEEEAELARLVREGGARSQEALDRLVRANLRFVVSVAKQYQGRALPLDDLINEGNIGLIKAARHFDETRGFKFISYAVWWIRQSIVEAIGVKSRAVRVPLNASGTASRLQRATSAYVQEFGWAPSRELLADLTGLPLEVVDRGLRAMARSSSIDQPLNDNSATPVSETLAADPDDRPDRMVERQSTCESLCEMLSRCLDERGAYIVAKSLGIGCPQQTLDEIGARLGLSRERVRQLRESAIGKLRKQCAAGRLPELMD